MATIPARRTWANSNSVATSATDLNAEIRDPANFVFKPPRLHAYRSSAFTATNNTNLVVGLFGDVENYPASENHSTTANQSRFTPQTAGRWWVKACVEYAGIASPGSTILCRMQLRLNAVGSYTGGTGIIDKLVAPAPNTNRTLVDGSVEISLSVGDYLEMFVLQNSGASVTVNAGQWSTFMQARWVGEL